MKLFNITNTNIINNCRQYFDNILMLNCLVLSGLISSKKYEKSSLNVTIFWQNFTLKSIAYIYLSFYRAAWNADAV